MFVRMLKLPEEDRKKYDLSSHRCAIHAAAPCPVAVKEQMMEWWGPIIYEYYGGSEGNGSTAIEPLEWLQHKGSVGRTAGGAIHICDDEGNELPAGELQRVFFLQLRIIGSTMGTRSELAGLLSFCGQAGIHPQIGAELPMTEAAQAFQRMMDGETGGKVVLTR